MYRPAVHDVRISARPQCAWNLFATEKHILQPPLNISRSGFLSLTDKRSSVTTSSCENDSSARRMPHIVSDDRTDVPLTTSKSSENHRKSFSLLISSAHENSNQHFSFIFSVGLTSHGCFKFTITSSRKPSNSGLSINLGRSTTIGACRKWFLTRRIGE